MCVGECVCVTERERERKEGEIGLLRNAVCVSGLLIQVAVVDNNQFHIRFLFA